MSENITFEQLPKVVIILVEEIKELKELLTNPKREIPEPIEKLLTVQETAKFLNLTVPTIYSKVSRGELPYMKRGKRLYFSSTELLEYLKEGRTKTNAEIEAEAEAYIASNRL